MLRDKMCYLLNDNFQKDTTYMIAEFLINNLEKVSEISIYQVAKECHTSVATVSRFCRRIGYEDYNVFLDACEMEKRCKKTYGTFAFTGK